MRMAYTIFSYFKQTRLFLWIVLVVFGTLSPVIAIGSEEPLLYDARGKRDPFVPILSSTARETTGLAGVETLDEIIIEGVVYDPKSGSVVIVNGTVLKEKDESGNVKVLEIKPDGAVFSVNGIEGFRPMYQEDKKGE